MEELTTRLLQEETRDLLSADVSQRPLSLGEDAVRGGVRQGAPVRRVRQHEGHRARHEGRQHEQGHGQHQHERAQLPVTRYIPGHHRDAGEDEPLVPIETEQTKNDNK